MPTPAPLPPIRGAPIGWRRGDACLRSDPDNRPTLKSGGLLAEPLPLKALSSFVFDQTLLQFPTFCSLNFFLKFIQNTNFFFFINLAISYLHFCPLVEIILELLERQ
jgi:hypothetical protein